MHRLALVLLIATGACQDRPSAEKAAVPDGWPEQLVVGFTPYYTEAQLREENAALVKWLAEQVGLPAVIRVATSYAELSEQLRVGNVHVADLSPFGYINAKRDNPGLELLVVPIAEGSVSYPAHIITHERTGIRSLEDLKGKRFAFVDRSSASGYLYPLAYLRNAGCEPDQHFGSVQFAGNHEALVNMVEAGAIDAGATFAMHSDLAKGKRLRVVATTGRIPLNAFCANASLPPALVERLRSAFLRLRANTGDGKRVLASTPFSGFASVDDRHYDEVRRVARLVNDQIEDITTMLPLEPPPPPRKRRR